MKWAMTAMLVGAAMQIAISNPAWGQQMHTNMRFWTGNDLWSYCGSTLEGPAPNSCTDYIMGVADGALTVRSFARQPADFCMPTGVTGYQVADVGRRYLSQHPELRTYTASSLVFNALTEAFPCPTHPAR